MCSPTSSSMATPSQSSATIPLRSMSSSPSSRTAAVSKCSAAEFGNRMRTKFHFLSRFVASLLLQRRSFLLLVPICYFWGMILMMEQGQSAAPFSSQPSSTTQDPLQQQHLDQEPLNLSHSDGRGLHMLVVILKSVSHNATSVNFFLCQTD
ncbi:hypothetical protein KP509_31G049500 [Ceratopteris richardii]|uniref:Uncharacterized protein n=1 Tax=Ceratopteris richardii TaxID=49495 RepID=A0A8T2QZA6_CERRI|nr:hypothetical protein KP509_31G049500 [Ceratopteris richardii]